MKNCLVYLLDSTDEDINDFNKSISLVEKNLLPFCENFDIIVFHEESLIPCMERIKTESIIIYKLIKFELPNYSKEILEEIPEFYPHPTHQNGPIAYWHKGFTMGYRHMCKFFFSDVFEHIKDYDTYMRLDSDSFVLEPVTHDIFKWFNDNKLIYSFIQPAIQLDNPKVCEGVKEFTSRWITESQCPAFTDIKNIPNGMVFYTNFEICSIKFFLENKWNNLFVKSVNDSGRIYSKRWGDHILRYLQIMLFCQPELSRPIHGLVYQHGAIYRT